MKHLLLTTIAAVVLVGCGESQQSTPAPEAKPVEPVVEVPAQQSAPLAEAKPVEPVAEAAKVEPPTAKAPVISIHDAALEGNIEVVKQHLAAGADVDTKHELYGTPLHSAANKEIAELLIANGADVNAKDIYDRTPLHAVAEEGHKAVADLLIANGADVNAKDVDGWTPLHIATREVAESLIANGADVNAKGFGGTPLDLAIKYNHTETADLLRKHGGKTGKELKAEGK